MITPTLVKPVFVVGHPRSGTTLLATVLGRNSQLSMPPETQFLIEQSAFANRKLGADDMTAILNNLRIQDLGLDAEQVQKVFAQTDGSFGSAFATVVDCYRAAQGRPRAGEKSPMHLAYTEQLLEWFPDASIVCIERNGVDVIASLLKMPWSHQNIRRQAYDWNTSVSRADDFEARFPDRFMRVRYERFAEDAEAETRRICAFCDLAFEPSMLIAAEASTVPDWEQGWKEGVSQPIAPRAARGTLTPKQSIQVAAISNRHLKRAGYEGLRVSPVSELMAKLTAWPYHPSVRPMFQNIMAPIRRVLK